MAVQDKKPRAPGTKTQSPKIAQTLVESAKDDVTESLFWFLRAIVKNLPSIFAIIILMVGGSVVYTKSVAKIYEASCSIEFDPDTVRPLSMASTNEAKFLNPFNDTREYYETQYSLMVSDRILLPVVRDLGLATDADFLGFKSDKPVPPEDVAAILRARVRVEPVKMSRLVVLKMEDTNPARVRRVLDAISRSYQAQNLDKTTSATADAVVWLTGQLDHYTRELEANENDIHEFKRKNDLPSSTLEEISRMVRMEMQHYDEALTKTRMRKAELSARHAEFSKIAADSPDLIPASELLSNAFLGTLRMNYQTAVRERRELTAEGKGDNHPQVKKLDERLALSRTALLDEIKNIRGALGRDLAILHRQEAGEAQLYEGASKRAVELNLKELEFRRLDRNRAQNEKLHNVLLEQLKQADLTRMMNVNNIRIIDPPNEPHVPVRPRLSTNMLVGAAVGLTLGLLFVFVREQLDNSVKSPEDLERRLGVTFLGLLPRFDEKEGKGGAYSGYGRYANYTNYSDGKKRARRVMPPRQLAPELIVHERPLSGIAEAARTVRTNLTFTSPDEPYRTLLVTSAAPGEGKTTVACSIAISLAQATLKVCIVDCDLRRPRLHRIFDRAGDAGLTNVLVGEATLEEVTRPTMIENLYCIPSGPMPPNPADMLHSAKFKKAISDLSQMFDRIVLDSPPLAAVTDAALISASVDATVFVIRAFSTSRALSKDGLRSLADVDANVVGAVLNAVDLRKNGYNYYERYSYYRREGYLPHNVPKEPPADQASPPN